MTDWEDTDLWNGIEDVKTDNFVIPSEEIKFETTYWDTFELDCTECEDGAVSPVQRSVDNQEEGLVMCYSCETLFGISLEKVVTTEE